MSHQATYTQGSVLGHVTSLSLTSAIGLFAIFIVDLVDVFFIALLGAPELAAAVGFAGMGLFLGASICIGVAISVATLVAQAVGEDDEAKAQRYTTHGLLYSLLWSVPVAALTVYYAPQMLALIGASDRTLDLGVMYFRIVGISLPVLGFAMAATAVLRAVGDPKLSMWSTIIGGLVNAVFDPIFIFALKMELRGAAVASVLSRITVAAVAILGLIRKHRMFGPIEPALFLTDFKAFNGIAFPSVITNLSGPVGSAYATSQMARFGTDAVAAASVIGRITPVAFAGLYGLSGAVGPVASQNVGARDYHRVRETLKAGLTFAVLYVVPVALLMYFLQEPLVAAFRLEAEAAELLRFFATFIVITYLLFALQLAANPIFTALHHPGLGTLSNFTRDIALAIPAIGFGAGLFGAPGVLGGQALANAIAGVATFAVALWLTRRIEVSKDPDQPLTRFHFHHHRAVAPGVQQRGH